MTTRAEKACDAWFTRHGSEVGWFPLRRNTEPVATLQRLAYAEWIGRVTGDHRLTKYQPGGVHVDRFDDGGTAELAAGQIPGGVV